jgi:hypothetical protein
VWVRGVEGQGIGEKCAEINKEKIINYVIKSNK